MRRLCATCLELKIMPTNTTYLNPDEVLKNLYGSDSITPNADYAKSIGYGGPFTDTSNFNENIGLGLHSQQLRDALANPNASDISKFIAKTYQYDPIEAAQMVGANQRGISGQDSSVFGNDSFLRALMGNSARSDITGIPLQQQMYGDAYKAANELGLGDPNKAQSQQFQQAHQAVMDSHHSSGLGILGSILPAAALMIPGVGAALYGALGTMGTGALVGGLGSALSGGDVLKGAVLGGLGGAATGYFGDMNILPTDTATNFNGNLPDGGVGASTSEIGYDAPDVSTYPVTQDLPTQLPSGVPPEGSFADSLRQSLNTPSTSAEPFVDTLSDSEKYIDAGGMGQGTPPTLSATDVLKQVLNTPGAATKTIANALGVDPTWVKLGASTLNALNLANQNRQNATAVRNQLAMQQANLNTPLSNTTTWGRRNTPRKVLFSAYADGGGVEEIQQALDQLRDPNVPARQVLGMSGRPGGHYVRGASKGQADDVHAALSPGEYVMDADTVSSLGDGNNEAGAAALDQMREHIRRHKRSAPANKIPPKAKDPMAYLKGAK